MYTYLLNSLNSLSISILLFIYTGISRFFFIALFSNVIKIANLILLYKKKIILDVIVMLDILCELTILFIYCNSEISILSIIILITSSIFLNSLSLIFISIRKRRLIVYDVNLSLNDWSCSICLDTSTRNIIQTKCSHIYHKSCIQKWITVNTTCPLCRTELY